MDFLKKNLEIFFCEYIYFCLFLTDGRLTGRLDGILPGILTFSPTPLSTSSEGMEGSGQSKTQGQGRGCFLALCLPLLSLAA